MNDIYLCIKRNTDFGCKKFKSFREADDYYKINYQERPESYMIRVNKLVPRFLLEWWIGYKIKDIGNKYLK